MLVAQWQDRFEHVSELPEGDRHLVGAVIQHRIDVERIEGQSLQGMGATVISGSVMIFVLGFGHYFEGVGTMVGLIGLLMSIAAFVLGVGTWAVCRRPLRDARRLMRAAESNALAHGYEVSMQFGTSTAAPKLLIRRQVR